jgi:tellurite resistance protein
MPQEDLYIGLGNLAYAVAKADGELSKEEEEALTEILEEQDHGDIALFAFKIKHHMNSLPEEAYRFALRRLRANEQEFSEDQKEQFIYVLDKVAHASKGVNSKEQRLLERLRKDLKSLQQKKNR